MLSLSACLDDLSFSKFTIEYPQNNQIYIGTVAEPAPNDDGTNNQLAETFVITYDVPMTETVKISLNGNDIQEYFRFTPDQAEGQLADFKQFLKQGKNTLSVDPMRFGPAINFFVDVSGPDIIITEGRVADNGTDVDITGFLREFSDYGDTIDLNLVQILGYDANGNIRRVDRDDRSVVIDVNPDGTFSTTVDIEGLIVKDSEATDQNPAANLLYSFSAADFNGYETNLEIIADTNGEGDSLAIKNALRVAVGDTFVESLKPIIASVLYEQLDESAIDQVFNPPQRIAVPILGLKPDALINRVYLAAGDEQATNPDFWGDINPKQGTFLLNGFKVKEGDALAIDLIITSLLVDLDIELLGGISLALYIEKIIVATDAITSVELTTDDQGRDKQEVSIVLANSNFSLSGIEASKVELFGLDLTGIAGALIGLLEGLIGDLLPGIVNPILEENINSLAISQRLYRNDLIPASVDQENLPSPTKDNLSNEDQATLELLESTVPYTDLLFDIQDLGTAQPFTGPLPFDLIAAIQTTADTGKADPDLKPILGTVFSDDPIKTAEVFNSVNGADIGTNLTVAINSNLINQTLASIYSIGQMHLTLYNNNTYFGANPMTPVDTETQLTIAKENDTRLRLWPDTPPVFEISRVGNVGENLDTAKALVRYPSAVLSRDRFDGSDWQTELEFKVDFDLAVLVDEKDGAVTLGAAGPPAFKINESKNETNFQISDSVIQGVLDSALLLGGDLLSGEVIVLDLNDLASGFVNGTNVQFLDANDRYTLVDGECAVNFNRTDSDGKELVDDEGEPITAWAKCSTEGECAFADNEITIPRPDGEYDLICQELELKVKTNKVSVIGDVGRNLFFQMEARDPKLPPALALPQLDLDDDGIVDFKDNCAIDQSDLLSVINQVQVETGLTLEESTNTETGEVNADFEQSIREKANALIAIKYGVGLINYQDPSQDDVDWFNRLRQGDTPLNIADLGDAPWLRLVFSNINQANITDEDNVGELCEDDKDRDGVFVDNYPPSIPQEQIKYWVDNCPTVQQLNASNEVWNIDGSSSYFLATETDENSPAGDLCDIRNNFVTIKLHADGGGQCVGNNTQMVSCKVNGSVNPAAKWYMAKAVDTEFGVYFSFYNNDEGRQANSIDNACVLSFENDKTSNDSDIWLRGNKNCNKTSFGGDKSRWAMQPVFNPTSGAQQSANDIAAPYLIKTLKPTEGSNAPRCFYKSGNNLRAGTGCVADSPIERWGILVGEDQTVWDFRW